MEKEVRVRLAIMSAQRMITFLEGIGLISGALDIDNVIVQQELFVLARHIKNDYGDSVSVSRVLVPQDETYQSLD